jgi:hypothetical protein
MCLPASLAAPLAIAGSVVSAAGALQQGAAANAQGKEEQQVAKQNAGLEIEAAHDSVQQGKDEQRDFWRQVSATKGQQIASMAANGIDVGYGSADRLSSDTQMVANENDLTLGKNIQQRTRGHYITAENYITEGKAARAKGKAAQVGSYFSAASSIMGGLSQAAGAKKKGG